LSCLWNSIAAAHQRIPTNLSVSTIPLVGHQNINSLSRWILSVEIDESLALWQFNANAGKVVVRSAALALKKHSKSSSIADGREREGDFNVRATNEPD
jgi:hypothetical protein